MDKEQKKELISDAALSCFLSSGYGGTSMDDIVKVSGVSKGGIYWHFKSKEDIFLSLVEKWFIEWDLEFIARLSEHDSSREKLCKFAEYYNEKVDAPIIALMIEFFLQTKNNEAKARLSKCTNKTKHHIIKDVIQEAVARGEFKQLDVDAATNIFISIFDGISLQWFTQQHKNKEILERTIKTAIKIYLDGVLNK